MIAIYGSPKSSTGRCVWALEEAGVTYELKSVDMRNKEHKSPSFLKLNPNGKIPVLTDGDFTLYESMAINSYIAESYKKDLLGKAPAEKALVQQWSYWASLELQNPIIEVFIQKVFVPEDKRDQNVIAKNLEKLPSLFSILDGALKDKKYLVGNQFSLADLNVASVASIATAIGFETKTFQNFTSWMANLAERPAFKKYMELRK